MENTRIFTTIQVEIEKLLELSTNYVTSQTPLHKVEMGLLKQLIKLGLSILKYIINEKRAMQSQESYKFYPNLKLKNTGLKPRQYLSLFGQMEIDRTVYLTQEFGNIAILDELIELPSETKLSYNIQQLLGENASETNFRESVKMLNKLLNLNLSGKTSERNVDRIGEFVDGFYDQKKADCELSPVYFSASFDGKGVPKIKEAKKKDGNPKARLGKGEKRGVKQMATVSVTSHFTPKKRSIDKIISTLVGSGLTPLKAAIEPKVKNKNKEKEKENDNKWHKNIHRRAFLDDQEKAVDYGIKDIKQRMKNPKSKFVIPIDAGIGLEDKVLLSIKKYGLEKQFDGIILDIIHVSEYVWKVGTAYFGEKSNKRITWVEKILRQLLNSETKEVIDLFKELKTMKKLSKAKIEKIDKAITYFSNHQHKMNYKKFIEKGYPISSALVESTCRHLVKDRLERSGMRWSTIGAQNMMDLRAIKLNDDFDDFMKYVISQDRKLIFNKAA